MNISKSTVVLFGAMWVSTLAAHASEAPVGGAPAPTLSSHEATLKPGEESVGADAPPTDDAPGDELAPDDPFADPDEAAEPETAEQQAVRAALSKPATVDPAPAHPELRPVFEQFGGEAGLTALMDDFMQRLLEDDRTRPFFEPVDQPKAKRHLVEQFCAVLGGGCRYTGRDMATAHAGLGIGRADTNALIEVLQQSMDARGIPFRAQLKLLAVLAPMHREVEER